MKNSQGSRVARGLYSFTRNPLGYILDSIVAFVINLFIPHPAISFMASRFRKPILGCLVLFIILGIFTFVTIGTLVLSPILLTSGLFQKIISIVSPASQNLPNLGFAQVSIPTQNPFGVPFNSITLTAGFMDPLYFIEFGRIHTGIDLVPNEDYYQNNQSFKQTQQVIIFATHSGTVSTYVDQYGGETVELTNNEGTLKTIYIHFSKFLVSSGSQISAGTPLGVIGSTGFATGDHVHYEIRVKNGEAWVPVNPLKYMQ